MAMILAMIVIMGPKKTPDIGISMVLVSKTIPSTNTIGLLIKNKVKNPITIPDMA
ncbi:hypothetical protein IY230_01215 [Acholeplasma laidlawii]|nr:hypothetical protein [Acholeplasma laidlawii]